MHIKCHIIVQILCWSLILGVFFIVFYILKIIASPWPAAISRIPSPLSYKEEDFQGYKRKHLPYRFGHFIFFKNMWMYACTPYFLFKTSPHQFFLSQSASTSVQTGQLFHQSCRPLVATAEVPERCKVQRSSVWRRLGDPSHVSLLMLSQGEVVTRPTGVTVPPPN